MALVHKVWKGLNISESESVSVLTFIVFCLQKEEKDNFLQVELKALYPKVYKTCFAFKSNMQTTKKG